MKKLLFTSLLTLFFGFSIFAQTADLQSDLQESFKKVKLVHFNNRAVRQEVQNNQSLLIPTAERNFELTLTPNDLRAARYRAEDTSANGVAVLESGKATTFKGKINGESDSEVRLTIDNEKVEGFMLSSAGKFFVESAAHFSKKAQKGDFVVYQEKDLLKNEAFNCQSDLGERIQKGEQMVAAQAGTVESPPRLRVLEIATDADFEYVTAVGGAAQANSEILGILNMIDGVYRSELGLTLSVVFQHTWTMRDPYSTADTTTLLSSFKDYWNNTYPLTRYQRDVAHLWTAKTISTGQGFAYIGVVCKNPDFAYGFSGKFDYAPVKYDLPAHEIGHNLGATHVDAAQSCQNTIMNASLTFTTPLDFCVYSQKEIKDFLDENSSCLTQRAATATRFDFDGDNKADIAVFRPSNGVWYIAKSTGGYSIFQFGQNGDKPVAADYDGDGKTDAAVFRNGTWYRLRSSDSTFEGIGFGLGSDVPAPADFDGDGKADVAVFRPSNGTWYVQRSRDGFTSAQFGANGDVPMPADFDGDGKADLAVWRPSNGVWYRLNSRDNSFYGAQFGQNGDKPVSGDFDGDGKADLAVWRPSNGTWYVVNSSNGFYSGIGFGSSTDIPTPADFDGDGRTDLGVYRPSSGVWYRQNIASGAFSTFQLGNSSDVPALAN